MLDATAEQITLQALERGAMQKPPELQELVGLLLKQRPAVVVEIGTMAGGTLGAWCECATPDAVIISIDLPGGPWGGGYSDERADAIRTFAGDQQTLVLLEGDSHRRNIRDQVKANLGGAGVDFLFIDGDHSYDGVAADFADYTPLVAPGGLVALHDVVEHPGFPSCQVDRFWNAIRGDYETTWEFAVDGHELSWGPWGGIGVIAWPGVGNGA